MLTKIANIWIDSYQSDKVAFSFELISFIFTVGASLTLALNAQSPSMELVYPFFFIGSTSQCYASIRRGSAWTALLTAYFSIINVVGFIIAIGIW